MSLRPLREFAEGVRLYAAARYLAKISGPLLDRIDLHIDVAEVAYSDLTRDADGEPSGAISERVRQDRKRQLARYNGRKIFCNAQMGPKQLHRHCRPYSATRDLLEGAPKRFGFSARTYDRILKVARTIADLEGTPASAITTSPKPSNTAGSTEATGRTIEKRPV